MSGHGGHDHHDDKDHFGRYVGIATAVLGLAVMITTIFAHKAHNATLAAKSDAAREKVEASNQWARYQTKRIRSYESEIAANMLDALGEGKEKAAKLRETYLATNVQYQKDLKEIQAEAEGHEAKMKEIEHDAHLQHVKGDRLDIAEGMLEFGVILCSLYFLSRKKFFPALGGLAALVGALMAGYAFFGPVPHDGAHGEAHPPAAHKDASHAPAGAHAPVAH